MENRLSKRMSKIEKVAASYRKLLNLETDNSPVYPFETGLLLVHAYPERIACSRPGNNAQFQLSNGKLAMAGHRDDLAHEPWLAVATVDARDGMGKIFLASPLNPEDLAPMLEEKEIISWDSRNGQLIAHKNLQIGSIVLRSTPLKSPDQSHKVEAICKAIEKESLSLLNFDKEVEQWQNRVLSLRKWRPEEKWPDVSTSTLLLTNRDWLSPYLSEVNKAEDLKKLNIAEILEHHLNFEQQQQLQLLAPKRFEVPSGSNIRIDYQKEGASPVLAVRLQEMFGLPETPTVNEGKTQILLHLLSPGF